MKEITIFFIGALGLTTRLQIAWCWLKGEREGQGSFQPGRKMRVGVKGVFDGESSVSRTTVPEANVFGEQVPW